MSRVYRSDLVQLSTGGLPEHLRALLAPPRRTDDGYLVVEGLAARTGVQLYADARGGIVREYRADTEVFEADSLASWEGVPTTRTHPAKHLDAATATRHARGAVLGVTPLRDAGWIKARITIYDADLIDAIESGRITQLSAGYWAEREAAEGVAPDGQRYDSVQRRIRINHLAVVERARAGATAQLRMDGDGDVVLDVDTNDGASDGPPPGRPPMAKLTIKGVEYEVDAAVASVVRAELDAAAARETALTAERDRAQALADSHKAALDAAPKADAIEAAVGARLALIERARAAVPGLKLDALDEGAIKTAVVKARTPGLDLTGKSSAYVDAAFDLALQSPPAAQGSTSPTSTGVQDAAHTAAADRAKPLTDRLADLNRRAAEPYGKLFNTTGGHKAQA